VEESLKDALLSAGERLSEALRMGLSERGLPNDVCVVLNGDKVVVASRSNAIRDAELGSAGVPPRPILESIARDAAPAVLLAFSEVWQDRTL